MSPCFLAYPDRLVLSFQRYRRILNGVIIFSHPVYAMRHVTGIGCWALGVNKKAPPFGAAFWVTNGIRTHDPQNHNLVL